MASVEAEDLLAVPTLKHFKQQVWSSQRAARTADGSVVAVYSNDGTEYIKLKDGTGGKTYSAKLTLQQMPPIVIKVHSNPQLLTANVDNYISRIATEKFSLLPKNTFSENKRNLLNSLSKPVTALQDNLIEHRQQIWSHICQILKASMTQTATNIQIAEDFYQIMAMMEHNGTVKQLPIEVSRELHEAWGKLCDTQEQLLARARIFPQQLRPDDFSWHEIHDICKEALQYHIRSVLDVRPLTITLNLGIERWIPKYKALFLSCDAMQLFCDMEELEKSEDDFPEFLDNLANNYIDVLKQLDVDNIQKLTTAVPPISGTYFSLYKTCMELIQDLRKTENLGEFVRLSGVDFSLKRLPGKSDDKDTFLVLHNLSFVFKLLEYFRPGRYSENLQLGYTPVLCGKNNIKSDNNLVWVYMLDNLALQFKSLHSSNRKICEDFFGLSGILIRGFQSFVTKVGPRKAELIRVTALSMSKYIAYIGACIFDTSNDYSSHNIDILEKQVHAIEFILDGANEEFLQQHLPQLIQAFNGFWSVFREVLSKVETKFNFSPKNQGLKQFKDEVIDCIKVCLGIKTTGYPLLVFFQEMNGFLQNLDSLCFDWFTKKTNIKLEAQQYLQEVSTDTKSGTYKVTDVPKFVAAQTQSNLPSHYLIEILQEYATLLRSLFKINRGQWDGNSKVEAASSLLAAFSEFFTYLEKQPEYTSFDQFKMENTEVFDTITQKQLPPSDFIDTMGKIKTSSWYIRKSNELSYSEAINKFSQLNRDVNISELTKCFEAYETQFQAYMQQGFNSREILKKGQFTHKNWSNARREIPRMVAGLAAIWSNKMTQSTGVQWKPHCMQIICIFRILGLDKSSSALENHLGEVLTGQGKSVVLALLAALLTLLKFNVRVVCYSQYLAQRDAQDFAAFFEELSLNKQIDYGTFEDLATEILHPEINGKKQYLGDLIKSRIVDRGSNKLKASTKDTNNNSVLLIDEVDVFFSDQFYGSSHGMLKCLHVSALTKVQKQIWHLAREGGCTSAVMLEKLNEYIKTLVRNDADFAEYQKFAKTPGTYLLLERENSCLNEKQYSNESLLQYHFEKMITTAREVADDKQNERTKNRFKLNDDGKITFQKLNGKDSLNTFLEYYNIFNYFRLRDENRKPYDDKGLHNYGYLYIQSGSVSFAKLPKSYRHILGVSGTLKDLAPFEATAINDYYNIHHKSFMPSFFGDSNLVWNGSCATSDSEDSWLQDIFTSTQKHVNSGRAVLVIFEDDIRLYKFMSKYENKLGNVQVLTENTPNDKKKRMVEQSGNAETVTLGTKEMGRGVDYTTSAMVEKVGGVHVTQTFFSADIKEETQVKGRTARKSNKGSYELILCKEHIKAANFISVDEDSCRYADLNSKRASMLQNQGEQRAKRIQESEEDDNVSMRYLQSFLK